MANKITYGPHLFPGGPGQYIRTGERTVMETHGNIRHTLAAAFSDASPDTLLSKLGFASGTDVNLSFMNYGNMQLVYLATIANKWKTAVLINQPHTPLGRVKEEFDNLKRLFEIDPRFVVEPFAHFASPEKGHEVYASQYIDNAMCVAVRDEHGVYDPLPQYHFESFAPDTSRVVNSSMLALLVNYYDDERRLGLAKTQTSGDDFILARGFHPDHVGSIMPNMKIIAARSWINASFREYLDILRQEFLIGTNRTEQELASGIRVNYRSKLPMTAREIDDGIAAGKWLRQSKTKPNNLPPMPILSTSF